jgi:hypothetical protein
LILLVLAGFAFRAGSLSAESLGEDELNKLQAVEDYRRNGITSANGEHPFLMKALQTCSIFIADRWNNSLATNRPSWRVAPESALRMPGAVFGALTAILIYLLAAELFGAEVGLVAAALWAFDPSAIGFNRIAKEDTFLLFFFLLANIFWLRGQRAAESNPPGKPVRYYWATAAAFGAMLASKYLPQIIAITISYYWLFQAIPETRWRLGKKRMLFFFIVMGFAFLALNPTVLLPDTWRQMGLFAGQKLVGHDGYEFMGKLYSHKMTDWLKGIPWYFYILFLIVKLPLLSLIGFLAGLPLLFRRKLGDGRYFILLWLFLWFMTFSFAGGKFTRYLTVILPAVLITAALGIQTIAHRLGSALATVFGPKIRAYAPAVTALVVVFSTAIAAGAVAPNFRLFTNVVGGGPAKAGYYFPHDEFYDASMRDAVFAVASQAPKGATLASETPTIAAYYGAERAGRTDLNFVALSDPEALKKLRQGDFIITARGRRYFSNDELITVLERSAHPFYRLDLNGVPSADVYRVENESLEMIKEVASHLPPLAENLNTSRAPVQ